MRADIRVRLARLLSSVANGCDRLSFWIHPARPGMLPGLERLDEIVADMREARRSARSR